MTKDAPVSVGAGSPDQPAGRNRGAAGGDEVVDQVDLRAGGAGIDMHRQPVGAIFQRIILGDGRARQLAVLADEEEAGAEVKRDGGSEDEPAGVDAGDQLRLFGHGARQPLDRGGEAARIEQQRRDVSELDAGLGKIRDGADESAQIRIVLGHATILNVIASEARQSMPQLLWIAASLTLLAMTAS
jgi:hypothetical protein